MELPGVFQQTTNNQVHACLSLAAPSVPAAVPSLRAGFCKALTEDLQARKVSQSTSDKYK